MLLWLHCHMIASNATRSQRPQQVLADGGSEPSFTNRVSNECLLWLSQSTHHLCQSSAAWLSGHQACLLVIHFTLGLTKTSLRTTWFSQYLSFPLRQWLWEWLYSLTQSQMYKDPFSYLELSSCFDAVQFTILSWLNVVLVFREL